MSRGGQLIREARLRAGLTQHEAAQRIGVTQSVVSRWENDGASPSLDRLMEVLRALGYDLQYFLADDDWAARAQDRDAAALPASTRIRMNRRLVALAASAQRRGS